MSHCVRICLKSCSSDLSLTVPLVQCAALLLIHRKHCLYFISERIVRQCMTTDKPVKGGICESVSLNNYAQPLACACILWDNPFWNSISTSVGKIESYAFCSSVAFIFPLPSAVFDTYQWCLERSLQSFCNIFLHLFQKELLGNDRGDAAEGKSAAQAVGLAGALSRSCPVAPWQLGCSHLCPCWWIAAFSVPNAQGLFSPSGSHRRMFFPNTEGHAITPAFQWQQALEE